MARSRFDICLDEVLRQEGGYVDHPADPGGATNMGITHKTLARWRKVSPWWKLPKAEIRDLKRAEARDIYRRLYWLPLHAEEMPAGLDLAMFDFAVNSGPSRATKALQAVVGVKADGVYGPLSRAAVKARGTSAGAVRAYFES